jgi:hypothetical protein
VALTAVKVHDLKERGFVDLFTKHKPLWEAKAKEAYSYTANLVNPTGQPVRPDDVLPLLVPALELADEFTKFLSDKRLTQKYWKTHFAEYILDTFWTALQKGAQSGTQQTSP